MNRTGPERYAVHLATSRSGQVACQGNRNIPMRPSRKNPKTVETLTHGKASRKNIPTAEYQPLMRKGR